MNENIILFGLMVNLLCMVLIWPRIQLQAAKIFLVMLLIQWIWEWGYWLELLSTTVESALFWDNVQFVPYLLIAPTWLYIGRSLANKPLLKGSGHPLVTFALPLLFILALPFDNLFHIIRTDEAPTFVNNLLSYGFGPLTYASSLWIYGLLFVSISLLASFQQQLKPGYRFQIRAVMFGMILPSVMSLPFVFGFTLYEVRDITPLSFALANLATLFGLARTHAFEYKIVSQLPIIAQMPVGILILDHRERVIEWNPLALTMLDIHIDQPGFAKDNLPIANLLTLNEEKLWELNGRHYEVHYRLLDTNEKLNATVVTIKDVTEKTKQKQSLEVTNLALNKLLQELTDAQEQVLVNEKHQTMVSLIQSLSHEFNTPLGNLITLLDGFKNDENQLEYVPLIENNVKRVVELIERVKQISSIKADHETENFCLSICIEELIRISRYSHQDLDVEFIVDIDPELNVDISRESLENTILQLISNSLKHAFVGIDYPKIRIEAELRADQVGIIYCDNGIGIPKELEAQLFLPYSNYSKSMSISSGIGLFCVHHWVSQSLKGRIRYTEIENKGACFEMTFPSICTSNN
jgi:signal transduction histidine kinase